MKDMTKDLYGSKLELIKKTSALRTFDHFISYNHIDANIWRQFSFKIEFIPCLSELQGGFAPTMKS